MDLKRATKEIERLQEQLEKAYGRHSKPSGTVPTTRKSNVGLPRLDSGLVNQATFGEEGPVQSTSEVVVLTQELESQKDANLRLKKMIGQLTESINEQISKKVNESVDFPDYLLEPLEEESNPFTPEQTEDVDKIEERFATTLTKVELILGEAFNTITGRAESSREQSFRMEKPSITISQMGDSLKTGEVVARLDTGGTEKEKKQ